MLLAKEKTCLCDQPRNKPRLQKEAKVLAGSPQVPSAPRPCALTDAQVGVDGGVAGSASQVLVFPVGDVLVGAGVPVLLGQAEVNDVHQVALLPQPHEEVVGLDVPVDEVLGVDVLNAADLGEGRASHSASAEAGGAGFARCSEPGLDWRLGPYNGKTRGPLPMDGDPCHKQRSNISLQPPRMMISKGQVREGFLEEVTVERNSDGVIHHQVHCEAGN